VPNWAGLLSEVPPAAVAAASGSPLDVNPTAGATQYGTPPAGAEGFVHTPYGDPTAGGLRHIGAAAPAPVAAAEAAKKDYTPTSFRPIYDAVVDATAQVGGKGLFYSDKNWDKNPEAARQWLQAIADAGGDYRLQDKYYNSVALPAGQTVYWPGDPARK
jgi:hypothetical protein